MTRLSSRLGGRDAALGLVITVVVLIAVVGNATGIVRTWWEGRGAEEVQAIFPSTQQLRTGNLVRIDGVDVGKVTKLESLAGGRTTKVTMDVKRSAGQISRDARANLRWRTVLGSAFYIDLDPGTRSSGELTGPIAQSRTTSQVELDDLTSVFRTGARSGLQTMPGELAQGLSDPELPAQALDGVADAAPAITRGVGALRGQDQDADLQRLVSSTAALTDVLAKRRTELGQAVAGAAATLETTGQHAGSIEQTLALAPGTLDRTQATVTRLDRTLGLADPLLEQLKDPAGDVGPTLKQLNPTVKATDRLLGRAVPLLRDLRPTSRSVARTAAKALPVLKALEPSIERVDHTILPYLARKDPETGNTTTNLIGGFAESWGPGFAGQRDATGGLLRFALTVGSSPLYLPCQTYINNPDKDQAVQCEALNDTLQRVLSYNPFAPAPGQEGSSQEPGGQGNAPGAARKGR